MNIVFADDITLETIQDEGGMMVVEGQSIDRILVDLHDQLIDYSQKDSADKDANTKERLVSQMASLVSTKMEPKDQELAADVMMSLMKQAEIDIRESLSDRLAFMDDVPSRVLHEFIHDVISVAEPVLSHSPCLSDMDLMYVIRSKPAQYWHAIARRRDLKVAMLDHLADTRDEKTASILLSNKAVTLHHRVLKTFTEMGRYSKSLAESLAYRDELPSDLAMEVYWHVSVKLRAHLEENFEIPKERLDAALQDILQDFSDTSGGLGDYQPTIMMIDLAKRYGRLNRISDTMLIKTLQRGQAKFFIALMAQRARLSHEQVFRMMGQVGGQGISIAAQACKINKENFVSLFLLSRSVSRGDRAVDAQELRVAIKNYDKLTPAKAAAIMVDVVKNGKTNLLGG